MPSRPTHPRTTRTIDKSSSPTFAPQGARELWFAITPRSSWLDSTSRCSNIDAVELRNTAVSAIFESNIVACKPFIDVWLADAGTVVRRPISGWRTIGRKRTTTFREIDIGLHESSGKICRKRMPALPPIASQSPDTTVFSGLACHQIIYACTVFQRRNPAGCAVSTTPISDESGTVTSAAIVHCAPLGRYATPDRHQDRCCSAHLNSSLRPRDRSGRFRTRSKSSDKASSFIGMGLNDVDGFPFWNDDVDRAVCSGLGDSHGGW